MKTLLVKIIFVAIIATGLVVSSCSQSGVEEQVLEPSVEQVQMKELIQFVKDIRPEVSVPLDVQTRGFWQSFKDWFKRIGTTDAGGYQWGRENGMNFWKGLRVAITSSLVTAINGDDARTNWMVNGEWKVYSTTSRQYKELGNSHNKAIYELCRDNPILKYGSNISDSSLSSMVEAKLKEMGYSNSGASSLEWGNILILTRNLREALNSSSNLSDVFTAGLPDSTLDYQFLDEYLNSVLLLNSREEMISFTEQVYTRIDSSPGVKREILKGMVSIALCSINLWIPIK